MLRPRRGTLLWNHEVGKGIRRNSGSNYASASPVTDGKLAIFFYGNGELLCFDFAGNRLWGRNLQHDYGPFAFYWTIGTSPLLYEGRLYVQVLQRDVPVEGRGLTDRKNEAYLLALDPATGKTLWRHVRPSDAVKESRESHTTPIPWLHEGRKEILIAGGDALSGHDPATGEERWRWGEWNPTRTPNWPLIASPVGGAGHRAGVRSQGPAGVRRRAEQARHAGPSGGGMDQPRSQAGDHRGAHAGLLRRRFLRAERLAAEPGPGGSGHRQVEMAH